LKYASKRYLSSEAQVFRYFAQLHDDGGTQEPVTTYSVFNGISDKFDQPLLVSRYRRKTTVTDNNGCWKIEGLVEGEYSTLCRISPEALPFIMSKKAQSLLI